MRQHYRVTGRVQGVGFRQYTASEAQKLGVSGWVRNLADNSVEAEAQGEAASLDELEKRIRRGPALSRVDTVLVHEIAEEAGAEGFEIRR